MAESFPSAPGSGGGSFPQGHEPRDDAPTQDADMLLFRRYRIIRELGRGGMGVVLLAHDTALDIPVAVKLVPDLVVKDTEAIADLRKEVLRGMALNHDGVVRTHHFEKDESGAGIVMEFVEGHTLTDLKVQQPGGCFDPEQILGWLDQLCTVLDYAHRDKRIVHRDLKPRNIMLTPAGRVKVADFGIAAVISDSMSRHSMEGTVSGTLSYMSPQQAQGMKPTPLDDIHALGATLYELLTGKPPFFRGNPLMIQTQVITAVPPSMAERRQELEVAGRTAIPPQWEATIAACLSKRPAARPQSAGEVLARLKALPVADPVRPMPAAALPAAEPAVETDPSPMPELAPPREAGGVPWAIGLVVLACVAAGGYLATTRGPRPHDLIRTATPAPPTPAPGRLVRLLDPVPYVGPRGTFDILAGTEVEITGRRGDRLEVRYRGMEFEVAALSTDLYGPRATPVPTPKPTPTPTPRPGYSSSAKWSAGLRDRVLGTWGRLHPKRVGTGRGKVIISADANGFMTASGSFAIETTFPKGFEKTVGYGTVYRAEGVITGIAPDGVTSWMAGLTPLIVATGSFQWEIKPSAAERKLRTKDFPGYRYEATSSEARLEYVEHEGERYLQIMPPHELGMSFLILPPSLAQ